MECLKETHAGTGGICKLQESANHLAAMLPICMYNCFFLIKAVWKLLKLDSGNDNTIWRPVDVMCMFIHRLPYLGKQGIIYKSAYKQATTVYLNWEKN